jgi:hypothetical protein
VPTALIAPKLGRAFDALPELDPLWRLRDTHEPVLGREEFQRAVWRAGTGELRIITVNGRRHSGLSFSKHILTSLLPVSGPILLEISADEVGHDARNLATMLLTRSGGTLPADEDWPDEARAGTTSEAWVRDQLAPALARHLARAAAGRVVWLIVEHLDRHTVPESSAYALLLALMTAEIDAHFMRFLLLGATRRIAGLNYRRVGEDQTSMPLIEEIEAYIARRAIHDGIHLAPDERRRWADKAMRDAVAADGGRSSWEVAALSAQEPFRSKERRA